MFLTISYVIIMHSDAPFTPPKASIQQTKLNTTLLNIHSKYNITPCKSPNPSYGTFAENGIFALSGPNAIGKTLSNNNTILCKKSMNFRTCIYDELSKLANAPKQDEMTQIISQNESSVNTDVLNHNFTTSLPEIIHHKKHQSFTEQIASKINRIGNRLSNISISISYDKHMNDCDTVMADVYGELCHILQENAAYLSRITHLIEVKDIPIYCKTVVSDSENDSRSGHLLLKIFELILEDYW